MYDMTYPVSTFEPMEPPVRKSHKRLTVIASVFFALAAIVAIAGGVAASHHSNIATPPENFLTDTTMLENSVQDMVQSNADKQDLGMSVMDVTCVEQTHRLFICDIAWGDDTNSTADVQVNAAGDNYVSTSH